MTDEKNKAATEDLTPTPTQAENDEFKAKCHGAKVEKREVKDAPEALPPTPTQAENDAVHHDSKNVPQQQTARRMEASKPGGGYQTRSAEPVNPKAAALAAKAAEPATAKAE